MKTQYARVTILLFVASPLVYAVQTRRYTRNDIEYELDLPSPAWQVISTVDVHTHLEFVNGKDPANGYLRLRKIVVDQPATASELFRQDEKWELQHFAGYVVCSECNEAPFKGRLSGDVFCYEYVISGRTMHDRIYYLQVDKQNFYSLRFTVAREKLQDMRSQMDFIAASFHLK